MRLGERDASGRPRPVPMDGPEEVLAADTIIPAISQEPVLDFLAGLDLARRKDGSVAIDPVTKETSLPGLFAGGDLVHGPASVIQAIADGRAVAETIARRHGVEVKGEPQLEKGRADAALMEKKSRLTPAQRVPVLPLSDRHGFTEVIGAFSPEAAALEASRCLDCDDLCSLCVTVCPNRANQAYGIEPFSLELPLLVQRQGRLIAEGSRTFAVSQRVQTLNIGDFCNECGNCDTFCPAAGAPYKDKPRFWIDPEGYREAKGDVFQFHHLPAGLTIEAKLGGKPYRLTLAGDHAEYLSEQVTVRLRTGDWALLAWEANGVLPEGSAVDLTPCGTLIALLNAETAVPSLI
jgi:putative selenate reductase